MGVSGITLRIFHFFLIFFNERRRTALGWGGSTKNIEKDDKSYSPRGLRHRFVFVFLVYLFGEGRESGFEAGFNNLAINENNPIFREEI